MGEKLIKITGINYDYLSEDKNDNSFKVYPVQPIDKHSTTIQKEYEEAKDEFKRLLEIEQEKLR